MKEHIQEITSILKEFHIKIGKDYLSRSAEELAVIYENLKIVQEDNGLSDDEMEEALDNILGK